MLNTELASHFRYSLNKVYYFLSVFLTLQFIVRSAQQ
ncbi:MAG: hypothetical protein ACJAW2_000705 [Shewanella sp.]|jgi:hypothetical protein